MIVYHRTEHADSIERDGFRDSEGAYMTDRLWRGVWVSALPLDAHEGASGEVVLALEIPEELFVEHEWVEEGKAYRESLIPAADLNQHLAGLRRLTSDEEDELWHNDPRFPDRR